MNIIHNNFILIMAMMLFAKVGLADIPMIAGSDLRITYYANDRNTKMHVERVDRRILDYGVDYIYQYNTGGDVIFSYDSCSNARMYCLYSDYMPIAFPTGNFAIGDVIEIAPVRIHILSCEHSVNGECVRFYAVARCMAYDEDGQCSEKQGSFPYELKITSTHFIYQIEIGVISFGYSSYDDEVYDIKKLTNILLSDRGLLSFDFR